MACVVKLDHCHLSSEAAHKGELCHEEEYEDDDEQVGGPVSLGVSPGDLPRSFYSISSLQLDRLGLRLETNVKTGGTNECRPFQWSKIMHSKWI